MASFLTSVHILNLKQYEPHHTVEVDCVKLGTKYNCLHGEYSEAKKEYFQSQCSKCEHQWRLKKNAKCVNKLLRSYKCLYLSWDLNQPLILFFSNGSIVHMELNGDNNTLLKVDIDNSLCDKILSSRIVDIVASKNCIYITYTEPKLTLIHINQDSPSLFGKIFGRKKGKLVGFEPKIINLDLDVHSSKSLERKLSLNIQRDLLLVWWKNSSDDVWPWTPITYLTDRVNMLIYSIYGTYIDLLCSVTVQDELLHASFSKEHLNQFFALEETKKDGEIIVNVCINEIIHGNCQQVYTTKLPLRASLIAFHWSSTEDKLLAADSDGLLLIYDVKKKSTIVTNLEFLPKHLSWHPQNCIALIVSRSNHILCFDASLNIINFKLSYKTSLELKFLELGSYFPDPFSIQKVLWQESTFNDTCLFLLDSEFYSFVLIKFSFGYITRYNITAFEIISQYLKSNSLDRAILVLRSLDWCYKSDIKFQCLSKIINCLLRKPLNFESQGTIELALCTFFDWVEILPKRIVEMYQHRMHHLARRFFHHLLRYCKFRKAFSLAVDLDSQDLFLDLYHVAKQKGEKFLAAVALNKAEEFESSDSCSNSCSSDCPSESSSDSNDIVYAATHQHNSGDDVIWSQVSPIKELEDSCTSMKFQRLQTNEEEKNKQDRFDSCSKSCSSDCPSESSSYSNDIVYAVTHQHNSGDDVMWSQVSPIKELESSYTSRKFQRLQTNEEEKTKQDSLISVKYKFSDSKENSAENEPNFSNYSTVCQYETESYSGPSVLHFIPEHSLSTASSYQKDGHILEHSSKEFNSENKICDNQYSHGLESIRENSVIEEENEEMEGTQIKLAHLGVI